MYNISYSLSQFCNCSSYLIFSNLLPTFVSIGYVPTWFIISTLLCYKWRPDGDGGQCGGALKRRDVCAHIGFRTPFYRDDTDNRGGGCQMQWSIRSVIIRKQQYQYKNINIRANYYYNGISCLINVQVTLC